MHKFIHRVSKGSRYNQIYIPIEMAEFFHIGDIVKVELIERKTRLYSNIKNLGDFKDKLIKEIFSFLSKFKEIEQIFLVGSFLTEKTDYRDIDLLIITKKEKFEGEIYNKLSEKFGMKFHVILIPGEKLIELGKICPLTRSMLYHNISNKEFKLPEKKIDKKHLNFLMMMPEDLLKIKAGSRVFYDNLRRLETIKNFLGKELNPEEINKKLKRELGNLFEIMKNNEEIDEETIKKVREIIKNKLNNIRRKLYEQEKNT